MAGDNSTLADRKDNGRAPGHYARRLCFVLFLVVFALICAILLQAYRPELQKRHWVWRCLHYAGPPDQFAPEYPLSYWWQLMPNNGIGLITVFCHERIAHSGLRRLVVVDVGESFEGRMPPQNEPGDTHEFNFSLWSCDPWILGGPDGPKNMIRPKAGPSLKFPTEKQFHLLNGIPDPSDASHFSFQYDLDGVRGTYDGWLRDDGNIDLQIRDGPLKPIAQQTPP